MTPKHREKKVSQIAEARERMKSLRDELLAKYPAEPLLAECFALYDSAEAREGRREEGALARAGKPRPERNKRDSSGDLGPRPRLGTPRED